MSALRFVASPHHKNGRFFSDVIVTGNHWASMAAVREGRAAVAAIDCVTYALTKRHAPEKVAGLHILMTSPAVPALPYVTAAGRGDGTVDRLRAGIRRALADPALAPVRDDLLIDDFVILETDDYAPIDAMEQEAEKRGYPQID
jgi:ABC-type phosphate/phosphonate transport system substrate-binding protein